MREFIGHQRRAVRCATSTLAALALAAGLTVALSAPVSAGDNMRADVTKIVVGTAPAGTTFTIHYSCTGAVQTGDLQFDASGNPTPANSNFFNSSAATCTISETVTGGASTVSYQCVSDSVNATCDPSGTSVTFAGGISANVDFTVTNTFVAAAVPTAVPAAARLTG